MTMARLTYPSDVFPADPQVSLDVPGEWESVATTSTRLAARAVAEEEFHTNVVVTIDRRPRGTRPDQAVDELAVESTKRPEGTISEAFRAPFHGQDWVGCELSWMDPRVGRILQVHLFAVIEPENLAAPVFLVQLTGSCLAKNEDRDYPTIKHVLSSVRIGSSEE